MKKEISKAIVELMYVAIFALIIFIIKKHNGFEDTVLIALVLILAKMHIE